MRQVPFLDRDTFLHLKNLLLHRFSSTILNLPRNWKAQREVCAKISD